MAMNQSEKQKLYLDILEKVLPYLRNLQTHGFWRRLEYGNFYAELELVHNLPRLLICPEFQAYDVYWLNTQARIFITKGRRDLAFHEAVCKDIKQLFALVPDELRDKLTWRATGLDPV